MKRTLTFALAAASAIASANLVNNPGFEADSYPAGGYVSITSLTGWKVLGNEVAGIGVGYLGAPSQEIDLSGAYDAYGPGITGGITQNLTLTPGVTYNVSFDVYTGGGAGYPGGVDFFMGGTQLGSNLQGNPASYARVPYSYTYTATNASTDITFMTNHGIVSHVDNVNVTAVPEPASFLALGLPALGLIRKRLAK